MKSVKIEKLFALNWQEWFEFVDRYEWNEWLKRNENEIRKP